MDRFWEANDLAGDLGFDGANAAFWRFCDNCGLTPIYDKPFAFDIRHVERRLRSICWQV